MIATALGLDHGAVPRMRPTEMVRVLTGLRSCPPLGAGQRPIGSPLQDRGSHRQVMQERAIGFRVDARVDGLNELLQGEDVLLGLWHDS